MQRQVVLVVALALMLSACGDDETPPGPSTIPSPTAYKQASSQEVCTEVGEGSALDMSTTNEDEAAYLKQWDACASYDSTGKAQTWLRNRSKAVWVLPGITWNQALHHTPSSDPDLELQVDTFHAVVSQKTKLGNTIYLSPGTAVRIASPPENVEWKLNLPLTITWEGQGAILGKFKELGREAAIASTSPKHSAHRAVMECTASILDFAEESSSLNTEDGAEVVLAGISAVNTAHDCQGESRKATVTLPDGQVDTVHGRVMTQLRQSDRLMGKVTSNVKPFQGSLQGALIKLLSIVR